MEQGAPGGARARLCAAWRDGEPEWATPRPRRRRPKSASGWSASTRCRGSRSASRSGRRRRSWARRAEPRLAAARSAAPLDHLALTALSDGWMPAAFSKLGRLFGAPTVDLTIHSARPWGERRLGARRLPLALLGGRHLGGGRGAVGARRHPARPVAPAGADPRMRLGYLGLGSNVGDRRANLQAAVEELWTHGVMVLASSSVYETEPVGEVLDQREFLNACVQIETELGAGAAARRLQGGRARARARRAGCGTGRGRSTSTCCCSRASSTSPSGCACRTARSRHGGSSSCRCSSWIPDLPGAADALAALRGPGRAARRAAARRARLALQW